MLGLKTTMELLWSDKMIFSLKHFPALKLLSKHVFS